MKRTYKDYLLDIITSVNDIEEFVYGMRFEDFVQDKKTINAVLRSLEMTDAREIHDTNEGQPDS